VNVEEYTVRYGYLKTMRMPKSIIASPAFKEEQIKLTKEETLFLLEELEKFRKKGETK